MNGFLHSPGTPLLEPVIGTLLEPCNAHRKDSDGPFSPPNITEQVCPGTPGDTSLTGTLKQVIDPLLMLSSPEDALTGQQQQLSSYFM